MGEYYGTLNEVKLGLEVPMPEKPEAMILYEQCAEFGIPLVEGGIMDQPFIWLQEYKIVADFKKQMELFELLQAKAAEDSAS